MKIFNFTLFLIATLSFTLLLTPISIRAEEADDVDEDSVINDEDQVNTEDVQTETEVEESEDTELTSSPYVKTNVLFIEPESTDLPAGRLVRLLVGFQNNGTSGFLVESIDGSLRYPQDFSYYIQNFSTFQFNKVVESDRESTFEYMFTPSETFSSRQFGLTVNLRYRNQDGKQLVNTVFNETINVVEPDDGLDGETFFLYVFLAAIVVLLAVVAQQFFSVFKKKAIRSRSTNVHRATNGVTTKGSEEVDFEWIPKEHLQQNKSPKNSPRQRTRNGLAASGNSSNEEQ